MQIRPLSLILSSLVIAGLAHAAEPTTTTSASVEAAATTEPPPPAPSADEIKKVTDYYLRGVAGGPVLVEFSLCAKVDRNADGKLFCNGVLGATGKKGDALAAFVKFFAPRGAKYDDLKIRYLLDGEVRATSDFTVSESWTGYANYKQTTATRTGVWEAQVLRGDVVLASRKITIQ